MVSEANENDDMRQVPEEMEGFAMHSLISMAILGETITWIVKHRFMLGSHNTKVNEN